MGDPPWGALNATEGTGKRGRGRGLVFTHNIQMKFLRPGLYTFANDPDSAGQRAHLRWWKGVGEGMGKDGVQGRGVASEERGVGRVLCEVHTRDCSVNYLHNIYICKYKYALDIRQCIVSILMPT